MKNLKEDQKKGLLIQARLTSKTKKYLDPYKAWDMLQAALKDHPELDLIKAEFRIDKEDEKTSI
jgi:hypothetical protein